ncbi:MAG: hypothetical protein DIU79_14620, partial [Actinobacteria bacterium]
SGLVNDWVKAKKLPEARNCIRTAEALGLHPDVVLYHAGHADKLPAPIRTYEIQHEIRQLRDLEGEQEVRLRRLEQLASQLGPTVMVRRRGRLPADTVRWMAEEVEMEAVPAALLRGRSPENVFIAEASGDCLRGRMIADGDWVFLERLQPGQQPRNGDIVAVRLHDEVTLKIWYRDGDWIELRDADDKLVHRFSIFDDYEVEGVVFARYGVTH